MSPNSEPLSGVDELRQANRLFLEFLRARPGIAIGRFGLPEAAAGLLAGASRRQIENAAEFPRALFRLCLPSAGTDAVCDPLGPTADPGGHSLKLTLLHSARSLSRTSAYSARLLLRLADQEIEQLRRAELRDVLAMSHGDGILRTAFGDPEWIWLRLLTESRPEQRRRLFLIGLQPDSQLHPVPGLL